MPKDSKGRRGKPPSPNDKTITRISTPRDTNKDTPKFCLHNLSAGFDVENLPKERRAAFALSLQQRAKLTWQQIMMADKHGQGTEKLPARSIRANVPRKYSDTQEFLVMRYDGRRPMVGVRANDVFHVLWIESEYGDLYDHGS
jgi:hypothetical protein